MTVSRAPAGAVYIDSLYFYTASDAMQGAAAFFSCDWA
jgi:hypothetical protein